MFAFFFFLNALELRTAPPKSSGAHEGALSSVGFEKLGSRVGPAGLTGSLRPRCPALKTVVDSRFIFFRYIAVSVVTKWHPRLGRRPARPGRFCRPVATAAVRHALRLLHTSSRRRRRSAARLSFDRCDFSHPPIYRRRKILPKNPFSGKTR